MAVLEQVSCSNSSKELVTVVEIGKLDSVEVEFIHRMFSGRNLSTGIPIPAL